MGGWRDVDGRTVSERRKEQRETDRAALIETARHRPLTLVKGLVGFVLIAVLCVAVLLWMR